MVRVAVVVAETTGTELKLSAVGYFLIRLLTTPDGAPLAPLFFHQAVSSVDESKVKRENPARWLTSSNEEKFASHECALSVREQRVV